MAEYVDAFEKYQGSVNWAQARAANIVGVWVKATNGNATATPPADDYVHGATAAGLRVGLYGYCTGVGSPMSDAVKLANEVARLGAWSLAPMCDFEDGSLPATTAARRSYLVAYFTALHGTQPKIVSAYLYLSGTWAASVLPGWWPAGQNRMTLGGMTVYLMDAEYGINNGIEHPRTHYTGPVAGHQYSSIGHVPGFTGDVDHDDVTTAVAATSTAEQENDVPLSDDDIAAVAHAVGAYKNPTDATDVDAHQHWVDATAALGKVNALAAVVQAGFKAEASADASTASAVNALGTQLSGTQVAVINAVVAVPGQVAANIPETGGGAMTDAQAADFAAKVGALLGPQTTAAVAQAMADLTFHGTLDKPSA